MANRSDGYELRDLLCEQSKELMAAKTLDADLDLAFQLQMQEAIKASLASQPSTSAPQATVCHQKEKSDGNLDLAATLMLEDVRRFTQELEDREKCQAEMTKMREDLDRRVFDHTFARDILNVPEDEWKRDGDNYHRPYYKHGGSSSSSSFVKNAALATECFRLYFKGLVSEERVRDMKVIVAAVGVAICDSRDYLIFEVKKPIEVSETGGGLPSSECVELRALIEALEAALSLGLQKVTFFCDDDVLYQYVTRTQPAVYRNLINQVSDLQQQFAYCAPSLVARSDVKYAFKSAREAIVSQIKWSEEVDNGKSLKETCAICFENMDVDKMFTVENCLHRYCFSCMRRHVEVKLLNGMMANCPHEGCKSGVKVESCRKFLAPEMVEMISQRIKESAIPVTQKVYCPFHRCSALMSKHEVLEYTKTAFVGAEHSGARKCLKCHRLFCMNCRVPWHYNMTCYDYGKSSSHLFAEDAKLKSLADRKLWRQCVKCNHMVELAEGCFHITCRCGYEFCYTCGAPWKNKKATCRCPIWDERNIIRRNQPQRRV